MPTSTNSTAYKIIYDGNCNLCVTLVQSLEGLDRGRLFEYAPMQDEAALARLAITPGECELGMLLINPTNPAQRLQGSAAAEEIARLLPAGALFVDAYRALPGLKWMGDRGYEQIRDNRYAWFGKRSGTYQSAYPVCETTCRPPTGSESL